MKKRLFSLVYTLLAIFILCGCGYFETEYVSVEDYAPPVPDVIDEQGKITVNDIHSLQQAILTIISNGDTNGKIVFDTSYEGDPTADMSKACWQVRTQDALCAYWVENISYELSKIVTFYEARLTISYSDYANSSENIVYLPYSAGIESVIKNALVSGESKLVILVEQSMYTAEDVSQLVLDVYRKNPVSSPAAPYPTVNMFSGSNMQRLYEISFYYELSDEALAYRREKLSEFSPFCDLDVSKMSDAEKALVAYNYLVDNCRVSASAADNTAYDALIEGEADSEGIALALVELCHQLGLDCRIVYGQHDWKEHCWNIIGIEDYFCHIDAGLSEKRDIECCFLKSDESFWESYRWDMSSYPVCTAQAAEPETESPTEEGIVQDETVAAEEPQVTNVPEEGAFVELEVMEEQQELLIIESVEEK